MKLNFVSTWDIESFLPDLSPLIHEDFGSDFALTLLSWCELLDEPAGKENPGFLWKMWAVQMNDSTIGVCGLYAIEDRTDELWLGWLGILPDLRNKGVGRMLMKKLYSEAKGIGCKTLMAYVGSHGAPLNFYNREGFAVVGRVKDYLRMREMSLNKEYFENDDDYIIKKNL